eukprot:gene18210-34438_t
MIFSQKSPEIRNIIMKELPKCVVVIGAGPSGLVAVKTLKEHGVKSVICLEMSHELGGTFVNKTYDDARLVSSRFITPFSDFRMPAGSEDHPTIPDYVAYLQSYSDHFGVTSLIRYGAKVEKVDKTGPVGSDARYTVVYSDTATNEETTLVCGAVCVCSGLHNAPRVPKVPGMEKFKGSILHTSEYKERSILKDKRVLVVGCGETGLDMACSLLVRRGFLSVPTEGAGDGVPLDTMITNLFESSYVHPWLEYTKLRWAFTTYGIRKRKSLIDAAFNSFKFIPPE